MQEQVLLNYFLDKATTEELAEDARNSQLKTSYDSTSVYIKQIESEDREFIITKEHLLKLCTDCIDGKLNLIDLNTIAFALFTTEFFSRDEESKDSEIIEQVIWDWDNPEIGHPLTLENMKLWKEYLETGNYNLKL